MMRATTAMIAVGLALTLGACANDTLFGSSDASGPTAALPAKPAVDPACATLASRIEALRKEGVVDRVEAAAKGKGSTVSVKRASLAQIADLEKSNAEFQAKCSTLPRTAAAPAPQQVAAGATRVPAPPQPAPSAKAALEEAAKQ